MLDPESGSEHQVRRVYDDATEKWWFSVIDIVQALTQQADYQTARKYWNKLKERLSKEGSQLVTACHQLKMPAEDGKMRLTDVATAETLLLLVQSVPSPKAEPIKLWLAKVGYERMQEMADPASGWTARGIYGESTVAARSGSTTSSRSRFGEARTAYDDGSRDLPAGRLGTGLRKGGKFPAPS